MKIVNFVDSSNNYRQIGQAETLEEALIIIKKFLDDHNYKSYYTRRWEKDGVTWFDVGSHTEFFTWGDKVGDDE